MGSTSFRLSLPHRTWRLVGSTSLLSLLLNSLKACHFDSYRPSSMETWFSSPVKLSTWFSSPFKHGNMILIAFQASSLFLITHQVIFIAHQVILIARQALSLLSLLCHRLSSYLFLHSSFVIDHEALSFLSLRLSSPMKLSLHLSSPMNLFISMATAHHVFDWILFEISIVSSQSKFSVEILRRKKIRHYFLVKHWVKRRVKNG